MIHGKVTRAEGIHTLVAYSYASAALRNSATDFTAEDVGKLAYQVAGGSYWLLTAVTPTWIQVATGAGVAQKYLPLVSGNQQAGTTYTLIGALPVLDWDLEVQASHVFTLNTLVQIPAASTARVRLYDVTHTTTLFESGIISGAQGNYNFGPQVITAPAGSAVVEFWMSTPTNTGGNATCLASGITIT